MRKHSNLILGTVSMAIALSACAPLAADPVSGLYATPIGNAPATANVTPYSDALTCLQTESIATRKAGARVAVGRIEDMTGKRDLYTGANITQGIGLFAASALNRAGLKQVERADSTISDYELQAAMNHTLSDSPERSGDDPDNFRKVYTGQIAGSDYYISGGLTELNFNIHSDGFDGRAGSIDDDGPKGAFVARGFVMNIALDLRLIDTISQEVVAVTAYQKQIIGREVKPGLFSLVGGGMIDISGGKSEMEPLQLGVRTLVERSVYDFAAQLYSISPRLCLTGAGATPEAVTPRAPYTGPYLNRSHWATP